MGTKVSGFGVERDFDKHVSQRAPYAHRTAKFFHIKGAFIDVSAGAPDAGKPIKLASNGKIDSSMYVAGANHNLLSAVHPDTVVGSPVRGGLIVGNATPKWIGLLLGATGKFLRSDGNDALWEAIVKADISDTPWAWADVSKTGSNLTDLVTRTHAGLQTVTDSQHHNKLHSIVGVQHTASGLTIGHVLTATSPTAFAFQASAGGAAVPVGVIIPYLGGYFTDGVNGGFTMMMAVANTIAALNTLLNGDGWYVCDGAALNLGGSPIFDGAGRYLPLLTDDRFIMGDTLGGTPGGNNAMAHTHIPGTLGTVNESSHTHGFGSLGTDTEANHGHGDNISVNNHTLTITQMPSHQHLMFSTTTGNDYLDGGDYPYFRRNEATDDDYMIRGHTTPVPARGINKLKGGGLGHNHGVSGGVSAGGSHAHSVNTGATGTGVAHNHGISGSTGAASVTENRPKFLGCFYIMRAI